MSRALIIPWLPRRLYVEASSPLEIQRAINPSHRDVVHDIILVPPEEASQIFSGSPSLPCRSWVRIRRGKYRKDLGYVLTCNDDMADVLVAPRERPYDSPEEKSQNIRALFNWHTAHAAGLTLTAIGNSRDITAFECNGISFFAGLLRLSVMKDELERVLIPHMDEMFLHLQSGIDPELVEESCVLFSSQFWREGDTVRSSSSELRGERAAVVAVNLDQRSVSLLWDNQMYHCPLLEQRRVFTLGDHVRVIAGPDRGYVGTVITILQDELVLSLSTDLSREVSTAYWCCTITTTKFHQVKVGQCFVESHRPDHRWSSNDPTVGLVDFSPPPLELAGLQRGDIARVIDGPHRGLRGHIDWISDDLVWIAIPNHDDDQLEVDFWNLSGEMACVKVSSIMSSPVDITLKFTKEKGYDVSVADEVRVARGAHYGLQGVVKNVRFNEGRLDLISQGEERLQVNILPFIFRPRK